MTIEKRNLANFEIINIDLTEDKIIEGYALKFNEMTIISKTTNLEVREIIKKGALKNTIFNDVVLMYDHEGRVLARQSNETLKLEIDNIGLKIWANLKGTKSALETYEEIKKGYIKNMSFSFTVNKDNYSYEKIGDLEIYTREIKSIYEVFDVSVVSIPAYSTTEVYARAKETIEKIEKEELEIKRLEQEAEIRNKKIEDILNKIK